MQNIHYSLIMLLMLMSPVTPANAQVSIGIGLPSVSIGINLPLYPELVRVPGYPVYYAPQMDSNYFFYDGLYWVYQDDNWYASSWYNGPWGFVEPNVVPLYILRVPVRYYRQPPVYFSGWVSTAPPRWDQHWGRDWEHRRRGWDRWNRGSAPAPAPLPVYQRQYTGDRYPRVEQQHSLRSQSYRYQPRDKAVREHFKQVEQKRSPASDQRGRPETAPVRSPRQQEPQRSTPQAVPRQAPHQQGAPPDPRSQPSQRGGEHVQKPAADHTPAQQRGPAVQEQRQQPRAAQPQREQQAPRAAEPQREQRAPRAQEQEQRSQDRGASQESGRGHGQGQGQGQGQGRDEERGRGRDK